MPFRSAAITVEDLKTAGFFSWALLDRRSGEVVGSANMDATTTTASMIKAWLAADYLRLATERGQPPNSAQLHDLEIMIRDSDNQIADRTHEANGDTASIQRMITMCQLTNTAPISGAWSNTVISARDTVRMGACIADGRAAGAQWTPWVLDMMRQVRGEGDFGIRKAFPADQQARIAIKNGWLLRDEDHNWHTNCLAIADTWVIAVLQRYPEKAGWDADFAHVDQVCRDVVGLLRKTSTG